MVIANTARDRILLGAEFLAVGLPLVGSGPFRGAYCLIADPHTLALMIEGALGHAFSEIALDQARPAVGFIRQLQAEAEATIQGRPVLLAKSATP